MHMHVHGLLVVQIVANKHKMKEQHICQDVYVSSLRTWCNRNSETVEDSHRSLLCKQMFISML